MSRPTKGPSKAPRELIAAASRSVPADADAAQHTRTIDAERAVLGAYLAPMLDAAEAARLPRLPDPDDWHRDSHRVLAAEIERRRMRGEPFDEMTVALGCDREFFEKIGGHAYLHGLSNSAAPSVQALGYLIRRIRSSAELRRMAAAGKLATAAASGGDGDGARAIFTAALSQSAITAGLSLDEQLDEARRLIEHALSERLAGREIGLPLPWTTWRRRNPWRPTHLGVIAARPGVGKTMVAAQAVHAALQAGKRVKVYSLEVPFAEWILRVVGHDASAPYSAALNGQLPAETVDTFHTALEAARGYQLQVVDKPGMTFDELMVDIDVGQMLSPADLIVVDHVGLVKGGNAYRHLEEHQLLGEISDNLKTAAKRHNCIVLGLVQINREGVNGPPQLHHLTGSDRIAAAADWVVCLDRPSQRDDDAAEDPLWIYMRKARSGESGWAMKLSVDWSIGRAFEIDWAHSAAPATKPKSRSSARESW